MNKYHRVSIDREDAETRATAVWKSRRPLFRFGCACFEFRPTLSEMGCPLETINLHVIHGRRKYRGSTRGAVVREREEVINHRSSVDDLVLLDVLLLEL